MAVVRLKRHYNEEPLDAVLLASKKRKTEDLTTEIFHFATTLKNQDDDVSTHISKVLNSAESKCLYKQHNYTNITEKLREVNKLLSQNNRFKVVNWFRSISDSDFNGDDENVNYEQGKGMTVVDIESDNVIAPLEEKKDGTTSGDYVYDIYYAPGQHLEDILVDNDFSWYPLYQSDLVDTYQPAGMEEVPDDEDDSNDENNWRNDYPDEDDLQESSGSEGQMDLAARMRDFHIGEGGDDEYGHRDLSSDEGEEDLIYGLDSDDVDRFGLGYASYKKRVCKDFDDESCTSCSNESYGGSENSEDIRLD